MLLSQYQYVTTHGTLLIHDNVARSTASQRGSPKLQGPEFLLGLYYVGKIDQMIA